MVLFFDCEVEVKSKKFVDFGAISEKKTHIHSKSLAEIRQAFSDAQYYCGHNIIHHDIPHLKKHGIKVDGLKSIDTLFWSVLLYPQRPYHKLVKDDKLLPEDDNNPLIDAGKAKDLFYEEVESFHQLDTELKDLLYSLLYDKVGFSAFFEVVHYNRKVSDPLEVIDRVYGNMVCQNADLKRLVEENPIELAYALSLIATNPDSLLPAWLLHQFPEVEDVMRLLRGTPCETGCVYCDDALNAVGGLKRFFGFDNFRLFDEKPLQQLSVEAALNNRSLIAVFPTGGGKSITYQLPALMSGVNTRSLTVVISPLQSLMKDQVDNLEKLNIISAGYINGLLDPIERTKTIERVRNGDICLLYISPESLRSQSMEKLLMSRDIARFVIDEAHCFSVWGHDFRVDYLYIGEFIKNLEMNKENNKKIPVSCFTATAKKQVIEDIEEYFARKLTLRMEKFTIQSARKNLRYKVFNVENDEEKYQKLRHLIEYKDCATIVYASRQKLVERIAERLKQDGYSATFFHGGMNVEDKIENQNTFMQGQSNIMVATNAFGMGVDKSDVGMVVHYDVSDSLENYVQEAGRAGRDETLEADCYILYSESDLDKHFNMLRRSKLQMTEIQQIWQAIKTLTKVRTTVSYSALEIAREAGWDEGISDIETKVKTAIATLEETGYVQRKHNNPRVFADSILVKSYVEAEKLIDESAVFDQTDMVSAKRIIKSLIGSKHRKQHENEIPEARVDYLCDNMALDKRTVMGILAKFKEINILADVKDLSCYVPKDVKLTKALQNLNEMINLEAFVVSQLGLEEKDFHIKALNELAYDEGIKTTPKTLKKLLNFLNVVKVIEIKRAQKEKLKIMSHVVVDDKEYLSSTRFELSRFIVEYLYSKMNDVSNDSRIMFSVKELKDAYLNQQVLLKKDISLSEIETTLFYLSRLDVIQLEGGFLVIYNPMTLVRKEKNNAVRYKRTDYQKLETYYAQKVKQVHIVGEYAQLMVKDYNAALGFVDDYFTMDFTDFISKYFKGERRKNIEKNLTPALMKKLFGNLSPRQLSIVNDKENARIVVAAGPGSGKTRLLVHKLASILHTEDIRFEQLLMLTFSRSAVSEFKQRLIELIGKAAHYIEIKTFHSFAFDVLGRLGSLEKTDDVMDRALEMIEAREVDFTKVTKLMLVVDEAQDMDEKSYRLIELLMSINDDIRVILVGDDDQNIFTFRGSSSRYMESFKTNGAIFYELPTNYRAASNLVEFSNSFVRQISGRMKTQPIESYTKKTGELRVFKHQDTNLLMPVLKHILSHNLEGSVGVLTRTNDQALILTGLLNKHNLKATLIQATHNFKLKDLKEVRVFLDLVTKKERMTVILPETWDLAVSQWLELFQGTTHINVIFNLFNQFHLEYPKTKYLTDLMEFIEESNYDDFVNNPQIAVSTYHKAKGKEFDNVFMLYDNSVLSTDEEKRLLYVGMTRARSNLHIHYTGEYFQYMATNSIKYYQDKTVYDTPDRLVYTVTHKDVQLGYFSFVSRAIEDFKSGDELELGEDGLLLRNGKKVLKLSKAYKSEVENLKEKGYALTYAKVKYLVYWFNSNEDKEVLIVLPELTFDLTINEIEGLV